MTIIIILRINNYSKLQLICTGLSFTRPSQLLQIYSDMEEANLSLIQHSQASEEMLERVSSQISNTRVSRFAITCRKLTIL